jgi:hypothetical protein
LNISHVHWLPLSNGSHFYVLKLAVDKKMQETGVFFRKPIVPDA